jgi:hypothetical protein
LPRDDEPTRHAPCSGLDRRKRRAGRTDPQLANHAGTELKGIKAGASKMPKFRIDAIIRAKDGNLKVLAAHNFEAEGNADVERLADDWAGGAPVGSEAGFRIVRAQPDSGRTSDEPSEMEQVLTTNAVGGCRCRRWGAVVPNRMTDVTEKA